MIINSNMAANNLLGTPASRPKSTSNNSPAIGADQAQLSAASETDLTAAGAPIQDVDEARNSTEMARQMIIAQNSLAMMAQANSLPLNALRLLQQ